jgi:hypothetical protein
MSRLRIALLSLALGALTMPGCIITQANVLAEYDLPNPFTIGPAPAQPLLREAVDLNTISEYTDHKDELEGLSDLAVVGRFRTVIGTGGSLELWITADDTNFTTYGQVTAGATKLWGPASIGAAGTPAGTVVIGWDESAKLFDKAGKDLLVKEVKGDGKFTAYIVSAGATTQTFEVQDGAILLVISGGI